MITDDGKPAVRIDTDNAPFWEACREERLVAQQCGSCGSWRWPPAGVCPKCQSWDFEWRELPQRGKVVTFVVVHRSFHPSFDADVPYVIAEVAIDGTDDGVVLLTNVTGCDWEAVFVGMPVEAHFVARPEATLPMFHPQSGADA